MTLSEGKSKMFLASHVKLVIFDVDGTIVTTKSGETFRKTADDWQWLPGRLEKLQELDRQGVKLAIATNQGGVAFEYRSEEHTSELQSHSDLVCRLLLEKKRHT